MLATTVLGLGLMVHMIAPPGGVFVASRLTTFVKYKDLPPRIDDEATNPEKALIEDASKIKTAEPPTVEPSVDKPRLKRFPPQQDTSDNPVKVPDDEAMKTPLEGASKIKITEPATVEPSVDKPRLKRFPPQQDTSDNPVIPGDEAVKTPLEGSSKIKTTEPATVEPSVDNPRLKRFPPQQNTTDNPVKVSGDVAVKTPLEGVSKTNTTEPTTVSPSTAKPKLKRFPSLQYIAAAAQHELMRHEREMRKRRDALLQELVDEIPMMMRPPKPKSPTPTFGQRVKRWVGSWF